MLLSPPAGGGEQQAAALQALAAVLSNLQVGLLGCDDGSSQFSLCLVYPDERVSVISFAPYIAQLPLPAPWGFCLICGGSTVCTFALHAVLPQVTHVLMATPDVNSYLVTSLLATQQQQPTAAAAAAAPVEHMPAAGPEVWRRAVELAAVKTGGATTGSAVQYGNVLVLLDEQSHAAAVWAALGLAAPPAGAGPLLRVSPGGLSVCEFAADPAQTPATVRCINNTAHL